MGKKEKLLIGLLLALLFAVSFIFIALRYRNSMLAGNRVLVYFVSYDEEKEKPYLIPVIREIAPVEGTEEKIRESIKELIVGPSETEEEKGITSAMPEGVELLNVLLKDGVAYLDFSGAVEEGGGSLLMIERLAQIVFTATHFPRVNSVRMQIEGEMIEYFSGEGITDVARPMGRENFGELLR
jgi:spore germination protein GerM